MDLKIDTGIRSARGLFAALTLAGGVLFAASPLRGSAQADEPLLSEMFSTLNTEALRVGVLLQAVGDVGVDGSDPDRRSVTMAAMRILLSGHLDSGFEYLFQTNFAGTPGMLDARVGWAASPRFAVHAGRFKTPFSRELLTFAGSIDLVNRSRSVDALAPGRQMGVQLSGRGGRVSWSAGGFTGRSNSESGEPLLGIGRLELASDPSSDTGLTWSLAASGGLGQDGAVGVGALGSGYVGSGQVLGADLRVERGRLLMSAEWMRADWSPTGAVDTDADGGFLTLGWRTSSRSQLLVRRDRYRAPALEADDQVLLGWNLWPTTASEIQVNWVAPVNGGASPHKLLVNFQVGF